MATNPYQPSITKLGNGVSLLSAPSASRNVGVFLIVRAGSRDETADTSGLAHYLEHMFFKGTVRRPSTKIISHEVDRLGASTNAYTDTEEVAYFAEGPASALAELADIITDMLSQPLFAAEEVERERNVVLQELSMRLADPDGWIWDRIGTVAWYLNGKIMRRRTFGLGQIVLLNVLTPIFRLLDRWLPVPPLSLIAVLRKPARTEARPALESSGSAAAS